MIKKTKQTWLTKDIHNRISQITMLALMRPKIISSTKAYTWKVVIHLKFDYQQVYS